MERKNQPPSGNFWLRRGVYLSLGFSFAVGLLGLPYLSLLISYVGFVFSMYTEEDGSIASQLDPARTVVNPASWGAGVLIVSIAFVAAPFVVGLAIRSAF